jgi:hypothetical protein
VPVDPGVWSMVQLVAVLSLAMIFRIPVPMATQDGSSVVSSLYVVIGMGLFEELIVPEDGGIVGSSTVGASLSLEWVFQHDSCWVHFADNERFKLVIMVVLVPAWVPYG